MCWLMGLNLFFLILIHEDTFLSPVPHQGVQLGEAPKAKLLMKLYVICSWEKISLGSITCQEMKLTREFMPFMLPVDPYSKSSCNKLFVYGQN